MPKYLWKGLNVSGSIINGELDAVDEEQLKQFLFTQQVALLEFKIQRNYFQKFNDFFLQVKSAELATLFEHIAMLTECGVSLPEALKIVTKQTRIFGLKRALQSISNDVEHGMQFSDAVQKHSSIFSPLICSLIAAGEQTGKLELILNKISEHLKVRAAIVREVKKAAVGPVLTLCFAVLIILGIFVFVIPQFQNIFLSLGKDLPSSTLMMFRISNFLTSSAGVVFLTLGLMFALIIKFGAQNSLIQKVKKFLIFVVPLAGKIGRLNDQIYVLQAINLSLTSGIPLKQALEFAAQTSTGFYARQALNDALDKINSGSAINKAFMRKKNNFFPDNVLAMIAVGEQTGELEKVLDKASRLLEHEMTDTLNKLTTFLQPVLLIFVGFIIAAMMLAVYMPIFGMANLF